MLGGQLDQLVPGDHVLLPQGPGLLEAFLRAAAAYQAQALVYVPQGEMRSILRTVDALSRELAMGGQAVVVLTAEPIVEKIRHRDRRGFRRIFQEAIDSARATGWRSVWMLGRGCASLAEAGEDEAAVEGETMLQGLMSDLPLVVLCPYGRGTKSHTYEALRSFHTYTF